MPVSLVFNIGLETFALAKSANGSCVRTTKELQTSGGSDVGEDLDGVYFLVWLCVGFWKSSVLIRIRNVKHVMMGVWFILIPLLDLCHGLTC